MFQRIFAPMLVALLVLIGASTISYAEDQDVRTFIQDLSQRAITTVSAQNISDSERNERFRQVFVSAFDIPGIGKFVLSRHWQAANPAQQTAFLKAFEDSQVLTWSLRFKRYNGVRLEIQNIKSESATVWQVDSQIIRPQGPPTPVQWRIQRIADNSLRIVDIVADGVSMALTYRDEYAQAMKSNGGNVDALLSTMRTKNDLLAKTP
jgi:phospholipid transport system substrate-binding protein